MKSLWNFTAGIRLAALTVSLWGVVSIYQFATVGTFVQKIHQSPFVLMIIATHLYPAVQGQAAPTAEGTTTIPQPKRPGVLILQNRAPVGSR